MQQKSETDRFNVLYRIEASDRKTAQELARDITVEQTVEIPFDSIPQEYFNKGIIGRIESLKNPDDGLYDVTISFRSDITAFQLTQFLNVLYGNISLKSGIKVLDISFPQSFYSHFRGPSHGIDGLRKISRVYNRPLACTALKPMGLSVTELASMAHEFASGGIDLIKDDHGITDQQFHRFQERVSICAAAVEKANLESGGNTLYFPCVSGTFDLVETQVKFALSRGLKGILIAPFLSGLDTMRYLSEKYSIAIMAHPALTGAFFTGANHGIAVNVLLGKIFRLAGADISIFPNWGGRFPFSKQECLNLAHSLREDNGWKRSFPCPAGGMNLQRLGEMISEYGNDSVLLLGGALMQDNRGIRESSQEFMSRVKALGT